MLKITDFEKDKKKINDEFRELENYKKRVRDMEAQVRRLLQRTFVQG